MAFKYFVFVASFFFHTVFIESSITKPQIKESQKIILTQVENNKYALKAQLANLNIQIMAHLENEEDWAKMNGCKVCGDDEKCTESCFQDSEYGIKCSQSYCEEKDEEDSDQKHDQPSSNSQSLVKEGKYVDLTLKLPETHGNIILPIKLASKMEKTLPELGRINLLNSKGIFGNGMLMVKDHRKDLTVYFKEKNQDDKEMTKNIEFLGPVLNLKDPSEDSDDSDDNIFEISQIKIRDLSEPGTSIAANSSPELQTNQLQIPLTKTHAELSITTNKLLLPSKVHKKLLSGFLNKYFVEEKCQISKDRIECESSLNIDKIDNVTIMLTLNGVEVEFPIRVLITSCQKKSCEILLGVSKQKKMVVLGDFLMNVFAVKHEPSLKEFSLFRLENQWSKNFHETRKYAQHELNFFQALFLLVFKSIFFVLKILFYLAIISLIINCGFHWREVLGWFLEIKRKIQQRRSKNSLNNGYENTQLVSTEIEDKIGSDGEDE